MKSIERRFNKIKKENLGFSSYECFWQAVSKQGFSLPTINRLFNKLVDKNDYDSTIKKAVLFQLYLTTKIAEDDKK